MLRPNATLLIDEAVAGAAATITAADECLFSSHRRRSATFLLLAGGGPNDRLFLPSRSHHMLGPRGCLRLRRALSSGIVAALRHRCFVTNGQQRRLLFGELGRGGAAARRRRSLLPTSKGRTDGSHRRALTPSLRVEFDKRRLARRSSPPHRLVVLDELSLRRCHSPFAAPHALLGLLQHHFALRQLLLPGKKERRGGG